jgi:hypothetical protein
MKFPVTFITLLLVPLAALHGADASSSRTSLTSHVFAREQIASHAVSDARYRFIRYGNAFEELDDLETDPEEYTNRSSDPALAEVKARFAQSLPANPAANRGVPAKSR